MIIKREELKMSKRAEKIYDLMEIILEERRILTQAYNQLIRELNSISRDERIAERRFGAVPESKNDGSKKEELEAVKDKSDDIDYSDIYEVVDIDPLEEIAKLAKVNSKPKKRVSFEKIYSAIKQVLIENEEPMNLNDLYNVVTKRMDYHVKRTNFNNNIMYRATKRDGSIQRVRHGWYQYKKPSV